MTFGITNAITQGLTNYFVAGVTYLQFPNQVWFSSKLLVSS